MSHKTKRFKKCRRLGINFINHPKAMKRFHPSLSRETRNLSNYGKQLLEKQRLKAYYNVKEKVIKKYISKIKSDSRPLNELLIERLELRLDNIVYRLGFAASIYQARQMVVHGHIIVNDQKVQSPSFLVQINDKIALSKKARNNKSLSLHFKEIKHVASYLEKDFEDCSGSLIRLPMRKEIPIDIQDHLVVEFYSRII